MDAAHALSDVELEAEAIELRKALGLSPVIGLAITTHTPKTMRRSKGGNPSTGFIRDPYR